MTVQQQRTRELSERVLRLPDAHTDGSGAFDANGNKISDLGTPTATTDATTKTYVDALVHNTSLGDPPNEWLVDGIIATGSSTARLLEVRFGEIKNVMDYGAVGNGIANDTAAIQAAITAAGATGAVFFPAGTYFCSAVTWTPVVATNNLTLYSDSDAVIKGTAALVFVQPAGGDVLFRGLTFDTWQSVISNAFDDTGTTESLEVRDCTLMNIEGVAINHERPINRCRVANNNFTDVSNYAIRIGRNVYAEQDTWQHISILHNVAKGIQATGSTDAAFVIVYGKYVTITGNHIENVDADSGEAWGIYTKSRWTVISENTVRDVVSASGGIYYINIKGSTRQQTVSPQGFAVVCSANMIHGNGAGSGGTGIRMQNDEICVTGNVVDGVKRGISTSSGSTEYRHSTIADNNIVCPDTASGVYGINLVGEASGVTCTGNMIFQGEVGIRIACTDTVVSGWIVDRNVVRDATAGITSNSSSYIDDISISGNVITGYGTYGIRVGEMRRVRIHDNTIEEIADATNALDFQNTEQLLDASIRHTAIFQTDDATVRNLVDFRVADDSAVHVRVSATAMKADGTERALYGIGGLFYRDGGSVTQQGASYDIMTAIESDATWGGITFNPTTDALLPRVQGAAGTDINWTTTVELSTVAVQP
jgi:polygalacturonase